MTKDKAIAELVRIWHSPHLDLSLKAGLGEAIDALKGEDGDLISRQDAIDEIERKAYRHTYLDQTIGIIKSLPSKITEYKTFCGVSIEEAARIVQEHNADQKTGEWETDMVYAGIEFYRCDQCDFRQSEKSRYCPNCGARMNGGEEG